MKKELAYSLFSHTVSYGSHGQVLDRVWIAEDGHQAWGYSTYPHGASEAEGVPSSLRGFLTDANRIIRVSSLDS